MRGIILALLVLLARSPALSAAGAPGVDGPVQAVAAGRSRIGTVIVDNYRPYTFVNDKGEPDGFSVAVLRAVARTIGMEVDIRTDSWEHAKTALVDGTIDVLPMMAYSAERDKLFDFSAPHTIAYDSVFVKKGSAGISTLAELSGKSVIVMNKDVAHEYLVARGFDRRMSLVLVDSLPEALRQLGAGRVDAAIMPKLVGLVLAGELGIATAVSTSEVIEDYTRPFSFAVREGNHQLLERLNYGLSILQSTGQYGALYKQWFSAVEDPHLPLKTALKYVLALIAVCLAFVAWSLVLRGQVRSRTRHLEAEIARRQLAERVIQESESRFRLAIEEAPFPIMIHADDGSVVTISRTWTEITGYALRDIPTIAEWTAKAYGEKKESVRSDIDGIYGLTQRKAEGEYFVRCKDGSERAWEFSSVGLGSTPDGRRLAISIAMDVSERKRSEDELRQKEERLRCLTDSTVDAIITASSSGRIVTWNTGATRMFGHAAAEVLGQALSILIPERYRSQHEAGMRRVLDGGEPHVIGHTVELGGIRRSGEEFPLELTLSAWESRDGRFFTSIIRDISERKQAEEQKARLEDQLRQSQKVEAIGRLAGGVAHDFNNLTAIVLGYAELLLERLAPGDPSRKWAEQILQAGRRSAALTRQLLAFSRKQTLQPEVLDLNALLLNFEKMLGRVIGENVELKFKLAANLGRVKADPGQLEQVVTNLAVNARDAMPLGGRLTVETADVELDAVYALGHESVVPGRYVLLVLTDTGCGMDEATMARLFEPFFTTKPKGQGTGLGLATSYGIVKQSGGYIWGFSEPNKGASFKIYLPRTDAEVEDRASEVGAAPSQGNGELILLVEDVQPLRELCETVLAGLGYRVSAAANGLEALQLVRDQGLEPDLVVTDVIMPGMSGAEMAQRLRSTRPGLAVLYMSGYPDETIDPHGVLAPGTPFIQKPFTKRALAAKVRETLEEKVSIVDARVPVRPELVVGRVGKQFMLRQAQHAGRLTSTVLGKKGAPATRRVLMIDDDEQYRELVQHFCKKRGHVVAGVDSAAAAIAALAGSAFDVLLVDLNIPGTSGEQVLREIRAAGNTAPAIILTGDVSSADMAVLGPLGAVQALEKSSNAEPLLRAIAAAAATVADT